jgi:choline dehydrogenase-like flavoprotein
VVAFFERMHGRAGAYTIDFEGKIEARNLRGLLAGARFCGVLHAPPVCDRLPVEGRFRIDGRHMHYDLHNAGVRLVGKKTLRPPRLWKSVTEMEVTLTHPGGDVHGRMYFRARDLPQFLLSWTPYTSLGDLRAQEMASDLVAARARLRPWEQRQLRALSEAVVHAGLAYDDLAQTYAQMPGHMQAALRAALVLAEGAARVRHLRAFRALPLAQRQALLERLLAGPARPLAQLLALPLRASHYNRPEYNREIQLPVSPPIAAEAAPRYFAQVTDAEAAPDEDVHAEVVVVGTGAGGAALAAMLAERGVAVAVVERGRYFQRDRFRGDPLTRSRALWHRAGMTFSVGSPAISIPLGEMVGGTTAINSGTCFRVPGAVLSEWRAAGFPEEFSPAGLSPYFEAVEAELQVARGERKFVGAIGDVVAAGADHFALAHAPLPRNAPGCDGQGECIFACPTDAKRSTNISYMPRALRAGAALFCGLPVTNVLMHKGRAVAVVARGPDRKGRVRTLRIRAERVVLACGSIATPCLLQESGVSLPAIGHGLSVHPALGMWAMTDRDLEPWRAIPQGYGVSGFEASGISYEGFYLPPAFTAAMIPLLGAELERWMGAHRSVAQFGFMVRDDSVGSVQRTPWGPLIRYSLNAAAVRKLSYGAAVLAQLLLFGGATEVLTSIAGADRVRTRKEAWALARGRSAADFSLLGAHPLGTCRMGPSSESAVVDFDHKVYGTENLYVVDGSAIPSSLGVNPQVTIMAMACRAAERIAL